MLRLILCSFIGLCLGSQVMSQEDTNSKSELQPDSNYITSYPELITVGVYLASPIMQLMIQPVNKNLEKYSSDFRGNFSDQVGLTLGYRKVALQLGIKTPFGTEDKSKGKSLNSGITLKIRKPNINLTAEYRSYRGYYDNNSKSYDREADTLVVRPDVRYKNIGANAIYNCSWKKYSYNAPLTFNERQLKSRIGVLLKGGLNYMTISSSDSTLLNSVQTDQFESFDDVRAINALILKAGPGLGINLVLFKGFYIGVNGFLMGNIIGYTYDIQDEDRSKFKFNTNVYTETMLSFGYNSKRLFAGISSNGDINIMRIRDARIKTNFGTAFVTAGYRFDAPKPFKNLWNRTLTRYLKL